MTRKRFVKLLMANGYSRNSANKIADDTLKDGYSYAEGYDQVTRLLPHVQDLVGSIADAALKAAATLAKFATAMGEAARAAAEAFNAAMNET